MTEALAQTAAAKPPKPPKLTEVASAAGAAPRPAVQISASTLKLAEHERNTWVCVVPVGTTLEDLDERPEAMAAIANLMHRGDLITAWTADDKVMFELVCMLADPGRAVCRVVRVLVAPESLDDGSMAPLPAGHAIRKATSGDSQPGWLVWRIAESGRAVDNILLNSGHHFETYEQARRYLRDHATIRGETPQGLWRG